MRIAMRSLAGGGSGGGGGGSSGGAALQPVQITCCATLIFLESRSMAKKGRKRATEANPVPETAAGPAEEPDVEPEMTALEAERAAM